MGKTLNANDERTHWGQFQGDQKNEHRQEALKRWQRRHKRSDGAGKSNAHKQMNSTFKRDKEIAWRLQFSAKIFSINLVEKK